VRGLEFKTKLCPVRAFWSFHTKLDNLLGILSLDHVPTVIILKISFEISRYQVLLL